MAQFQHHGASSPAPFGSPTIGPSVNGQASSSPFDDSVEFHKKFEAFMDGTEDSLRLQNDQCFQRVFASSEHFRASIFNFLTCRQSFAEKGKPVSVEVMFHYTRKKSMKQIQYNGLQVIGRRSFYGDGIYVANNPHAFKSYGDVGLIVLVMKGRQRWCLHNEEEDTSDDTDSFAGNKLYDNRDTSCESDTRPTPYFDEIVLRQDDQVLPLFQYPLSLTNNADLFRRVHKALQSFVVDTFPGSWPPRTQLMLPNYEDLRHEVKVIGYQVKKDKALFLTEDEQYQDSHWKRTFQRLSRRVVFVRQEICHPKQLQQEIATLGFYAPYSECCQGCQQVFGGIGFQEAVVLNCCQLKYHPHCFRRRTPCSCPRAQPTGTCPLLGHLQVESRRDLYCQGLPQFPALTLHYNVDSGCDERFVGFEGTQHTAYLPDNDDGRALLLRLCYAFRRGLTFHIVAASHFIGPGQVQGTGIPHKTELNGGNEYGWPDPNYFVGCNQYLDKLGVPAASELI